LYIIGVFNETHNDIETEVYNGLYFESMTDVQNFIEGDCYLSDIYIRNTTIGYSGRKIIIQKLSPYKEEK